MVWCGVVADDVVATYVRISDVLIISHDPTFFSRSLHFANVAVVWYAI